MRIDKPVPKELLWFLGELVQTDAGEASAEVHLSSSSFLKTSRKLHYITICFLGIVWVLQIEAS